MDAEEKTAKKPEVMAAIGQHYAKIKVGRQAVAELETAASEDIRNAVKLYGPGPHKMAMPGAPNMIVSFRKFEGGFRMSARNMDDIT